MFTQTMSYYGMHRALKPKGVLPQVAEQLSITLPLEDSEVLIHVTALNLDSASFRQIREVCNDDISKISSHIMNVVQQRGKMHNPVTGSGGMLLGQVKAMGKTSMHQQALQVGDEIATLVSLTLTPLHLDKITKVDLSTGQLQVQGYAILFSSGIAVKLPEDILQSTALSLLDVCGAPALVCRHLQMKQKVLIVGAGKSGMLSAFAALEKLGDPNYITMVDINEPALQQAAQQGFHIRNASVLDPLQFIETVGTDYDLVINTSNVDMSEMPGVMACKPRGKVIFFNMRTAFARAVLGAEGIGADVDLLMGCGYAEGHADFTFYLYRKYISLQNYFNKRGAV